MRIPYLDCKIHHVILRLRDIATDDEVASVADMARMVPDNYTSQSKNERIRKDIGDRGGASPGTTYLSLFF